jgi:hypothetical protein
MITRITSDEESINRMQKNLMLTRKRMENLEITAPVDENNYLNAEVGEVINSQQWVHQYSRFQNASGNDGLYYP